MSKVDENIINDIEKILAEADAQMEIPIQKGAEELGVDGASCSRCTEPACCTQSLFVHFYEILPLARHLRVSGLDTPDLRDRLFEASVKMEGTPRPEYLDSRTPCVFLSDEKTCTVYQFRPSRCRTYFVFSDPTLCQPPSGNVVKFANYTMVDRMIIALGKKAHQYLRLKETQARILMASFPRAVLIALEAMDDGIVFKDYVRRQTWPSTKNLEEWIEGAPPADRLVRIRTRG
jgi:Fe-S-cluster containining protein